MSHNVLWYGNTFGYMETMATIGKNVKQIHLEILQKLAYLSRACGIITFLLKLNLRICGDPKNEFGCIGDPT